MCLDGEQANICKTMNYFVSFYRSLCRKNSVSDSEAENIDDGEIKRRNRVRIRIIS